ncbi:MAG: hypothetical protein SGPRY_001446 [Prymnesium sp.]
MRSFAPLLCAASGHALPSSYREMMTSPHSELIDFYPVDFSSDLNGKKFSWQAVALLPFIDASRLRAALAHLSPSLTPEEKARDSFGDELLFLSARSSLAPLATRAALGRGVVRLGGEESRSFGGSLERSPLLPPPGADLEPPAAGLARFSPNQVVGVAYKPPPYSPHSPRLLASTQIPPPVLPPHEKPHLSADAAQAIQGLASTMGVAPPSHPSRRGAGGGGGQRAAGRMILGAMGKRAGQR